MYRRDTRQTAIPFLKVFPFLSTPFERDKCVAVVRTYTWRAVISFLDLPLFLDSLLTCTSRLAVCLCGIWRDAIPFSNLAFDSQMQLHTTFR